MKKKILLVAGMMGCGLMQAQDIYKMEMLSGQDLNGTARFVGMGGAMNAIGADISTMSTNPAGIGLFRRGEVSTTASLNIQTNGRDLMDHGKTRMSFDQLGVVVPIKMDDDEFKYLNFGFNYHKYRNLKGYVGTSALTGGLSQSWQMVGLTYTNRYLDLDYSADRELTTPLTLLGYDTKMLEPRFGADGKVEGYDAVQARDYNYQRVQWGGVHEYDFNFSANFSDQIFVGMTVGVYDVDIHSGVRYGENIYDPAGGEGTFPYAMVQREHLSGSGVDFKFGVILRPIETGSFRIGAYVHSPIFYALKSDQYLVMESPFEDVVNSSTTLPYTTRDMDPGRNEYNLHTPWRFNLSMGGTLAGCLALDAEYEYRDYSTCQVRYPYVFDEYDYFADGEKDHALKREAENYLSGVSTIRLGAELRAEGGAYLRAGYNHETSPFKKDAFLNQFTPSSSYYYSCTTDYINLSGINRWTGGIGYRGRSFYADMAYQYQHQSGRVYPFHVPTDYSDIANRLSGRKFDMSKHQIMLTLGYRF